MMDDLSGVRALEVDDSASWRRFVTDQLRRRSVQVIGTAADGLDAVRQAQILQPDIILMDISMPRMNGLDATRAICTLAPTSKILIVTSHAWPDIVQAAF